MRFFRVFDRAVNGFLAMLMLAMVVIIAAQVWFRFVMNDPLAWSEEAGRYLFVWISFVGAAAGVRYRVHLGIDLLPKLLSKRAHRAVTVAGGLLVQIFLAVIAYWGFKILGVIRFQVSPSMQISMLYPYLAVPVGSILMLINSLRVTAAILSDRPLNREIEV